MSILSFFKPKKSKDYSDIENKPIKRSLTLSDYNFPSGLITVQNPFIGMYRSHGVDHAVYLLYCDFESANKWILDAVKPDAYFSNYQKCLLILEEINSYTGLYDFRPPLPSEQIELLSNNYSANTNRFIKRYWEATLYAARKLKTENGKTGRLQKFFDSLLIEYKDYLNDDNIEYINSLDKTEVNQIKEEPKIPVICKDYDMHSVQGIRHIPYDDFAVMRLLQKCATNHKRNGDLDLAIECLRKSNQISDYSTDDKLSEKEYFRVLRYIKLSKDFSRYQAEEELILQRHPEFWDKRVTNKIRIQDDLAKCRAWNCDLVTIQVYPSCPLCSRYKNRIYSISGYNTYYPHLPKEIINQTHPCKEHTMSLNIYHEGITSLSH